MVMKFGGRDAGRGARDLRFDPQAALADDSIIFDRGCAHTCMIHTCIMYTYDVRMYLIVIMYTFMYRFIHTHIYIIVYTIYTYMR
jgi:hypothetical protein